MTNKKTGSGQKTAEEQKACGPEETVAEAADEKSAEADRAEKPESEQGSKAPEEKAEAKAPEEDEDLKTRYLRLMADFQNYKRRVEKEKSDVYAYANEKLVGELLNVIDNFDRALGNEAAWADKGMLEGMSMILKQFWGVLEKSGVEEIKAEGQDFDPAFHHAVLTEEAGEHESGKITAVLQKGYMLNTRVIRPTMVKVAE